MNKVNAHIKLNHLGRGEVVVNDTDISNAVRAVTISSTAFGLANVTLELAVVDLEIDDEVSVDVPPGTRAALIALGWTPPAVAE